MESGRIRHFVCCVKRGTSPLPILRVAIAQNSARLLTGIDCCIVGFDENACL